MLISVPGERFPRARLKVRKDTVQSFPSPRHYVPAGLSARAVPAGVVAFHSNQQRHILKGECLMRST